MKRIICSCLTLMLCIIGCGKDDNIISTEESQEFKDALGKVLSISPTDTRENSTSHQFFRMVHISDAHVSPWSRYNRSYNPVDVIEAVAFANMQELQCNALVCTGDLIGNNPNETSASLALKYMDAFASAFFAADNKIPSFVTTGNHDQNMLNVSEKQWLNQRDLYIHAISRINYPTHNTNAENYYYADVDNPQGGKIRFIAMDVTDGGNMVDANTQDKACLTQKQISWLCETALKEGMTERTSVIVLIHHPLPIADTAYGTYFYDEYLHGGHLVPDIIEAFRCKTAIQARYCHKTDTISVNTSFEGISGEFICYLGGHVHLPLEYQVEIKNNKDESLPKQWMILANNMNPEEKNSKSEIDPEGRFHNAFNIYSIDTQRKMIHIVFYGSTSVNYPGIKTLKYL